MSAEEPVVKSEDKSVADQNAQAAEDAKKMLAELQGDAPVDAKPATESEQKETNGAATATTDTTSNDKPTEASEDKPQNSDRRRDRRDDGRRGDGNRGRGRGRGRGGRGGLSDRNNIKSDLTSQEVSDDPVAIRKQVEFYFSDSNLPMDKFLLGKVGGSENNPVDIKIIHSFKRMRHFQPFEAIVEALKESTFLELTDDNTCVKRKEPLPEVLNNGPNPEAVQVFEDKAMPRSVYVKGFGEEVPSTQFDVEAFFSAYGPTNAIRLRRTDEKIFKRSVFVEFANEELAEKFLNLDPKPTYKGKDLLIMSKKQYCEQKVEDIKSGKIRGNTRGSGRGRDFKRKREGNDDRDWRDRRDDDRKNGFKDDKRRGGRDSRGRDSRGKGGRGDREQKEETDERGVPVIKTTTPSAEQAKRDSAKEAALAKARAIVERDSEKTAQAAADNTETTEQDGSAPIKTETANTVAESIKEDAEAVTKKRSREDDDGDAERNAKKVDVKAES